MTPVQCPDLHFVQYNKAYMPSTDLISSITICYHLLVSYTDPVHSFITSWRKVEPTGSGSLHYLQEKNVNCIAFEESEGIKSFPVEIWFYCVKIIGHTALHNDPAVN